LKLSKLHPMLETVRDVVYVVMKLVKKVVPRGRECNAN